MFACGCKPRTRAKGNSGNVRGSASCGPSRSNCVDGDGPATKRRRFDDCPGIVNNPMGDTGANVHIGTDSTNKSSRIIQNVHISSITGANKFTGRCKQTFHLVEHNTTHTRPVTLPAIDSDAPQIPHDIVSIGRLLDSHKSNSFGLNGPKGLTLRLHDDTGSAFTTAVYWSNGTAWLSARTNPIGQFDTANALTRSQRKLILSNKTTSHTVGNHGHANANSHRSSPTLHLLTRSTILMHVPFASTFPKMPPQKAPHSLHAH